MGRTIAPRHLQLKRIPLLNPDDERAETLLESRGDGLDREKCLRRRHL